MKILYEKKLRIIDEIEENHIHLDDGTVIRNNEIIKTPLVWISKYSREKELKKLYKFANKTIDKIQKMIEKKKDK